MSFLSILLAVCIDPLKLLFETIFHIAYELLHNPGLSIIFLSLAMNLLVLPLYRRADKMQEEARDVETRLQAGVSHIKKTFTGNERMMMLQTYYRQNDYSPTNALRGSVSLLLEIPFFMAAYQFLSHLPLIQGVAFGPIANLGAPDRLLTLFGMNVNLLPILMTLINVIASAIYLRGFPLKTKIQLYVLAGFFLVFLYNSPAGLVFYWTLNNVFSLCKNIVYKIKKNKSTQPDQALSEKSRQAGGILSKIRAGRSTVSSGSTAGKEYRPDSRLFFSAAAFLAVLTGLLIPSTYIAASPQEFVDLTHFYHPVWFIVNAAALAAGTFLLWFGVFYWLASPRGKVIFERFMWGACFIAAADYICFGRFLGNLSHTLQFDNGLNYYPVEIVINVVIVALIVVVLFRNRKWAKKTSVALVMLAAALAVLSGTNIVKTVRSMDTIRQDAYGTMPKLSLSRTEQNVVVLFLDRALGEDFPYLLGERPDLKETYDGFIYYSNVISYGGHTNFGAPALLGGYEYTPVELNKRSDELLVDKHNESLKVMPVLFMENGFDVTVCDPPYANYNWNTDLSVYDEYPAIRKYAVSGYFGDEQAKAQTIENNKRNFFCFSLMKTLPVPLQYIVYDSGNYHRAGDAELEAASTQVTAGRSAADGLKQSFMESYEALTHLEEMTQISDDTNKSFLLFYNDAPHEPMMLKEPEYVPAKHVDNAKYDAAHEDRFTIDGKSIEVSNAKQMMHYQTNMAVMLRVGDWLEYLKREGVYDNTKIIIVADHGYYLYQSDVLCYPEHAYSKNHYPDVGNYFPLLMVKDFGAHGFTTDDTFMTNADVPSIAFEGLIENPVNPFTGKAITTDEKTAHDQFVISDHAGWDTDKNNGTTFDACHWAAVTDNIWDRDDWEFIDKPTVLKEHAMP
ncbi:MAG: YidC/Oxa1 family membrane protein insertase [Clostridiales bacterium]|nr:YidC/Oxa1 family membrane protein insertase [Clostridiales bacterium]